MDLVRRLLATLVAVGTVAATMGCGSGEPDLSVEVVTPRPGEFVSVPFEVIVNASVPLGLASEGRHHVHIWFGEDERSYLVVESDSVEINSAPDGNRVMHVSLRNPDHSPAGAETAVSLIITGGSSSAT